jgi:hypothetical protein
VNHLLYHLLRLSLLLALVLAPGVEPPAGAQAPQPSASPCQPGIVPGKIIGGVRNSDGQPLQGVVVTAHATTGATTVVGYTNAGGEYRIAVPPGAYLIEFQPTSGPFQSAWYKSGSSSLDATPVEVGNDTVVGGIEVELAAGAQFSVTLRDAAGEPVAQGLVFVFDRYDRKVAEGQADDQGRALTVPGLPPGGYRLLARPPYGSPLLAQYHNQKPTLAAADPLTVTQALGSLDVPITLQRGASLSGTVTTAATGAPLAGIAVEALNADGIIRYAITDAQGRYSIEGLPSATYRAEFGAGQPQESAPAPLHRLVALSAPDARTGFDAALAPGGAISGRVTAADGAPIPDVSVNVRDIDGARTRYGTTAADGTYAIRGLPSGRYTITYAQSSYQALAPAEQVTVTAPNTTSLANSVLSEGGAIAGKVTDPDGKPVAGVYVSVLHTTIGAVPNGSSYTNAAGEYTTPATLPNGSYVVKFQPPTSDTGCHLAIEYSGNAATAAAATRVQMSAATTVSGIDAKLDYGGLIGGRITDATSGLPLYGTVQVYDATGALVVTGVTGMAGHYRTVAGLPPGAYRVQFRVERYVTMFYGGATVLEAAARVPSGTSNISMALPRGGTLTGRITAADTGAPLEHAAVTLYGAGDRVVATQLTAFDGSYQFRDNLPSGTYRLGVAPGKRDGGTPYFIGYTPIFSGGASSLAQAPPVSLVAPKMHSADLAMPATIDAPPTPPPGPSPRDQHVYLPLLRR